jgi:hypothetical protein
MRHLISALAFALALCGGRVDAAVYFVVTNATTSFATFAACANQCHALSIVASLQGGPASTVTPQVVVTGGGACTAQIIGSNDGINWENVGSAIAVTAGSVHGGLSSGAALTATWNLWSATVTTLSGTGATCTVTISG